MGRYTTGALTTSEVLKLDINELKRSGRLIAGAEVTGYITWTNNASVSFRTHYGKEIYIELFYMHKGEPVRERVEIGRVDSNLGRGEVLYFICPIRRRKARILYLAYGSRIFKSREAYRNRIYYPGQISSKPGRALTRYWELGKKIDRLDSLRDQSLYKGSPTKRYERLEQLQERQSEAYQEYFKRYEQIVN